MMQIDVCIYIYHDEYIYIYIVMYVIKKRWGIEIGISEITRAKILGRRFFSNGAMGLCGYV